MNSTKPLTRKMKAEITKQWQELFPYMGIYENMQLLNICGPLAVGIHLYVDSDRTKYTPCLHVHNLCLTDGVLYLLLPVELRERFYFSISTSDPPDKYIKFAEKLAKKSVVPMEGDIYLRDLIETLKKYFYIYWNHIEVIEIITYLVYWSGSAEIIADARKFGEKAIHWLITGPERVKYQQPELLVEKYKKLVDKLEHTPDLQRIVEQQIIAMKMKDLPRRKMIF